MLWALSPWPIMPLLCCMTIVLVRNRGSRKHECVCVVTTFYSTVLHCTGIGSHRDLFRKKQMPEIKAQLIWSPFKILFFLRNGKKYDKTDGFSRPCCYERVTRYLTVKFAPSLRKYIVLASRFLAKYWSKKDGTYFKRGAHHSSSRVINCVAWKYFVR